MQASKLLSGSDVAHSMNDETKVLVDGLNEDVIFHVITVGDRADSRAFVKAEENLARRIGIKLVVEEFPEGVEEVVLLESIRKLNDNGSVDAIVVQLPLPVHINSKRVCAAVRPDKDADGVHPAALGALALRREPDSSSVGVPLDDEGEWWNEVPEVSGDACAGDEWSWWCWGRVGLGRTSACTALAVMRLLAWHKVPLLGKRACVVGASYVVGAPLAMMLMRAGCTVTVCHKHTVDLKSHTLQAELLVSAVGCAGLITGDMVANGVVVVDVGINEVDDATKPSGVRIVGDVCFDEVKGKAEWVTPVPGGVGPVTVATLMRQVVKCHVLRRQLAMCDKKAKE